MIRRRAYPIYLFTAAIAFWLSHASVLACSWAMFASSNTAVAGRTMDTMGVKDSADVVGIGRGVSRRTAEGERSLEYVTSYASIQISGFGGVITDALNEKGLQGSVLYLEGSRLPDPVANESRYDMDPFHFLGYAVSTCATVKEVILRLGKFNFLPQINPLAEDAVSGYDLPVHYAFADANGDNALIEFIDGKIVYYLGRNELAVTNEPAYSALQVLEAMDFQPSGSINTIDRWARAKRYLADMRERGVDDMPRAIQAMRGLLATVFAGYTEIDPDWGETYHTQWWAVVDLRNPTYYLTRLESWCAEIYDFSLFPREGFVGAINSAVDCPYEKITAEE